MANWTAVIPVKRLDAAKSRLRGAVPSARHQDLALAMLRDTAAAVLACAEVAELLVVTDDPAAADAAAALGARAVPDRPDAGLNDAMRYGADVLAGRRRNRVVLAGDLPALRPAELTAALTAAAVHAAAVHATPRNATAPAASTGRITTRFFVADAAGTGTTLLAAPRDVALDPHFGPGSAAAHRRSGATELTGDWPGLRQDVDVAADLRAVLELGPGRHTCALLRDLGLIADCGSSHLPAA